MLAYAIRRLLLTIPTLFGISVVTFLIVSLAPGDPASLQSGQDQDPERSARMYEMLRKHFELDKPLFFNFNPTQRSKIVEDYLRDLDTEYEPDLNRHIKSAKAFGTILLAPAMEARAAGRGKEPVSRLLVTLLSDRVNADLKPPAGAASDLEGWWAGAQANFTLEAGAQAAQAYLDGTMKLEELAGTRGSVAVPALIAEMYASDPTRQWRALQGLEKLSPQGWIPPKSPPAEGDAEARKELDEIAARWDHWWGKDAANERSDLGIEGAWRWITETRYCRWLASMFVFDFGTSFQDGRPIGEKIAARLWPTMSLSILSIFLGLFLAVPVGIYAAAKRGGLFDSTSGVVLYALYAVPSYVTGILLIYIVGVKMDLLPFQGMTSDGHEQLGFFGRFWDYITHYILITICYMYGGLAYNARFVRQNLLEVVRQDYVRTARAKGLAEPRVILRHAFSNTMIPLVTRLGLMFPAIISGSVILEVMFNWPGIGRLFFTAVLARDHPMVMALAIITAVLVLVGTLISDLLYAIVDPRISYA